MNHILIAPDSFKGSLQAIEVAQAIAQGVRQVLPQCRIDCYAMADGGEGSLEAVLATCPGERRQVTGVDALGSPLTSAYAVLDRRDRVDVLIEVAMVVPLPGAPGQVARRSSYGVGLQLRDALALRPRTIQVALGGSSTNDAGAGLLAALGARFFRSDGRLVERPALADLATVARADFSALDPGLALASIEALTDVDNPLYGGQGATAVFGPQKGIGDGEIAHWDAVIGKFAALCEASIGRSWALSPGAGAAGGLGWALQLAGARRVPGARAIAAMNGLAGALGTGAPAAAKIDWVLTGEGRSDAQTLRGKVPMAVAQLARAKAVPVTLLSGGLVPSALPTLSAVFDGCFSIVPGPMELAQAIAQAPELLCNAAEQLTRLRIAGAGQGS